MSKIYKALWLDDKPDPLMIDVALTHGIIIKHFKSNQEGFSYLAQHLSEVDAVILDAISFQHQWQDPGTESIRALDEALSKLAELRHKKNLPYFILSGQPNLKSEQDATSRYENFYAKSEDEQQLFDDLKTKVDAQEERQLRYDYAPAFEACVSAVVSEKAGRKLLEALLACKNPQANHQDDTTFTTLRIIIDEVFSAAIRHQLLPRECAPGGNVNLSNCAKLLSGSSTPISATHRAVLASRLLPNILVIPVQTCLGLTSTASHADQIGTIADLTSYRQTIRTPYLLIALTHQVMDLLVWFKTLVFDSSRLIRSQTTWTITIRR